MKILVSVKRVVDYNVRIQVKSDGSGVVTDGVKMNLNPFDEIALEEAIRFKEVGLASEIVVITLGEQAAQEQLRSALAMGADRAIHVQTECSIKPLAVAQILAEIVRQEEPQLVLMGKQAIDDDFGQTPQMLAAFLDWPQATYGSNIEIDRSVATVTREMDAGIETLAVDLPAIISVDLRLNTPRYIKLPDIMKAKRKPINTLTLDDVGIHPADGLTILKTSPPPVREPGRKMETVQMLVAALQEKGILL